MSFTLVFVLISNYGILNLFVSLMLLFSHGPCFVAITRHLPAVKVDSAPPGTQACAVDIHAFHRTCPASPHHKPWLVVCDPDGDFYIDHTHPFGLASASSNAGMIGNAIIDIWTHRGIGPIAKYENDINLFRFPTPGGPFVKKNFCYDYDKEEALRCIIPLQVPWHASKGDPHFLFVQVYIGFLWDLPNRTVSLPPEKLQKF